MPHYGEITHGNKENKTKRKTKEKSKKRFKKWYRWCSSSLYCALVTVLSKHPNKIPKINFFVVYMCLQKCFTTLLYMCAWEHLHNAAPCAPCHFALIRNKQKFRVVSLTPWQSLLSATVIRNRAAAALEGSQFPMLLLFSRLLYFLLLFVCLLSSSNINHTSQHLQYNLQSCNKPRMSRDVSFQQLTKKWRHRATVKRLLIHQPNDLTPASATEWRQ